MNELQDIELFQQLNELRKIFQKVGELSYTANQAKKRYPAPEAMTSDEMEKLVRMYLALGLDIEQIHKDWKKIYDRYKNK